MSPDEILNHVFFGNSVLQYLMGAGVTVLIWAALSAGLRPLLVRLVPGDLGRAMIMKLRPVTMALIALYIGTRHLEMSPRVERYFDGTLTFVITLQVIEVAAEMLSLLLARNIFRRAAEDPASANALRNVSLVGRIVLWVGGTMFLLSNLGININSAIAGLGIGGIAVALAVQNILGDAFNSFVIQFDKPFEVGDFIVVDQMKGRVEEIGLKTTRVRSVDGELIIFANSLLMSSRIRNYKRMYERRVNFKLNLAHGLDVARVRNVPELIKKAIEGVPQTRVDAVFFEAIADAGLVFDVSYWFLNPKPNPQLREEINFKILEAFRDNGVQLAGPPALAGPGARA